MILDNAETERTVGRWITDWTGEGQIDAVTGYFTVGALAYLCEQLNERVSRFRFIIGDIVCDEERDERPLDLLSETVAIDGALQLRDAASRAVAFLRLDRVFVKTLEPNFCHAKAWAYRGPDVPSSYYITGSSNLTEAGLGLKRANNIELNTVGQGTDANYEQLTRWFAELWQRPEAKDRKTVGGKRVNFKQYLIDEISRIFVQYTPRDLYFKLLFEVFGRGIAEFQGDPAVNRNLGRLEHSAIYAGLYEYQRKGVLSLIKMIQTYGGAILADAVGLGKTWSALAVMKYYQSLGHDILLLCPKKLDRNWRRFLRRHGSRFEDDALDYVIRYHTDLQDDRMERSQDGLSMEFFQRDRPKLLVIDESHNLRNSRSNRYRFLVDQLLRPNSDIKVLLLSATPINNTLIDVRNQLKLLVRDQADGFRDSLGINNLDALFRRAAQAFRAWSQQQGRTIASFIAELPAGFFRLTDALVVARTRKLIQGHTDQLVFPDKAPPTNIFLQGSIIGKYRSFEDFLDAFPKYFSGYMPAFYVQQAEDVSALEDERQRDFFLTKMMHILLVKRLESSWFAFQSTVEKVYEHHRDTLAKVRRYRKGAAGQDEVVLTFADLSDQDEDWADAELTLGKRAIPVAEIAEAGQLDRYKNHLETDTRALEDLRASLALFEKQLNQETGNRARESSRDEKLTHLMRLIREKRRAGHNRGNPKVLIFTAYTDTANYLYDQLLARGYDRLAVVTGSDSRVRGQDGRRSDFEPILERFAPYTKLFVERQWPDYEPVRDDDSPFEAFQAWSEWVHDNDARTATKLAHPVDILIATDCLSEGQNLQDCDYVVNYDIHWNPVRVIQRMGRIDRLGSINDRVFAANFWPTEEIDTYLRLQRRIEDKMAQMRLIGSEVRNDFTERMREILDDEHIQQSQEAKLLRQLETSWADIDSGEQGIGFDTFSLEGFRQDLMAELAVDEDRYDRMPNAVYTGFESGSALCPGEGIIALLGYPARRPGEPRRPYDAYDVVYIDSEGRDVLVNPKEILNVLSEHKDRPRLVPQALDDGDPHALAVWSAALKNWLAAQTQAEQADADGAAEKVAGAATMDLITQLQHGSRPAKNTLKTGRAFDERYDPEKVDLILWFAVSRADRPDMA